MARYFVGYLIQGEAAEYQQGIMRDLVARFRVNNILEKIPPYRIVFFLFVEYNLSYL